MNITFYKSGWCALFPFMVSYANKFNKRQGWGNCYGLLFLLYSAVLILLDFSTS